MSFETFKKCWLCLWITLCMIIGINRAAHYYAVVNNESCPHGALILPYDFADRIPLQQGNVCDVRTWMTDKSGPPDDSN